MRCARIKKERGTAVYHCISRAVAGAFLLDDEAKTAFRKLLWEVAEFSGVEVLAYCLMDNHFHILLRVPERDEEVLTKEEVLRRYEVLYAHSNTPGYPDASALRTIFAGDYEPLIEDWMARLTARMSDVSECLKTLKQRFTMWYNKRHKRFGTLWAERFKSVLVQDDAAVVRTVAAYIDLNPVRAGLVEDPATYAWCSYGEAMNGVERARCGLVRGLRGGDWAKTKESYRNTLFGKVGRAGQVWEGMSGESGQTKAEGETGRTSGTGGPTDDPLRRRIPVLTEGKVLGSEAFVAAMSREVEISKRDGEKEGAKRSKGDSRVLASERKPEKVTLPGGVNCFSLLRGRTKGTKG